MFNPRDMQTFRSQQEINDALGQRPRLAAPGMQPGAVPPPGSMGFRPQMPQGMQPQGVQPQGMQPQGGADLSKLLALLAQHQAPGAPSQPGMQPGVVPGQMPVGQPQGGMPVGGQVPYGQPQGMNLPGQGPVGQPAAPNPWGSGAQLNPQLMSLIARYGQQR
jgi:hypothetical protein